MIKLRKIISGGQTGADEAGLMAARMIGLETGGIMPKGFRTENGSKPQFAEIYGVKEHWSADYRRRTEANVIRSDGTLIFGRSSSRGSSLTIRICMENSKPFHIVQWQPAAGITIRRCNIEAFRKWLNDNRIDTLNVAGNRESHNRGITIACCDFLVVALSGN
jgi:hypothetical protein